jgi:hypothetical protein
LCVASIRKIVMPERKTLGRLAADRRSGKAPSTQAGEFVREEFEHIREGRHGARSPKQAIAIGLSKARRAGVDLPPPEKGTVPARTRRSAKRDLARGKKGKKGVSRRRSQATLAALEREGRSAASHGAISRQTKSAAKRRRASARSAASRRAASTKGATQRVAAARKAARTRARKS